MTRARFQPLFFTAVAALLVSACGGAGEDGPAGNTSSETAQSASANGVMVADDSVRAQRVVLTTARAVIAVGGAAASVDCAGGGSALFTATGAALGNGLLDAGEEYTMQFTNCRSSSGSATVTGSLTLTVHSASGDDYVVGTRSNVIVGLPQRTLSFNGNATLSHAVQTSGTTQVTTDRWVSPSVSMTSLRHNRITTLSLTQVDLTQSVTTTHGVVTGSSNRGTLTMTYAGWLGSWSATIATEGPVSFHANGTPLSGRWLITLPRDLIVLTIANDAVTAALDLGHNGSIERTLLWPILLLAQVAD